MAPLLDRPLLTPGAPPHCATWTPGSMRVCGYPKCMPQDARVSARAWSICVELGPRSFSDPRSHTRLVLWAPRAPLALERSCWASVRLVRQRQQTSGPGLVSLVWSTWAGRHSSSLDAARPPLAVSQRHLPASQPRGCTPAMLAIKSSHSSAVVAQAAQSAWAGSRPARAPMTSHVSRSAAIASGRIGKPDRQVAPLRRIVAATGLLQLIATCPDVTAQRFKIRA